MPEGFDPTKFDPHEPAFIADPYPTYASFREHAPVQLVKPYENHWIFGYDGCAQVLGDTDVWVKKGVAQHAHGPYGMMSSFPENLFQSDPPRHIVLRKLLEPLIGEVLERAPGLAQKTAQPLLEAANKQGRIELVAEYALPLPARVLFTLLGIPNEGEHEGVWEGLMAWQAAIAAAHDITQPVQTQFVGASSMMALNSFFQGMLLEGPSKSTPPEGMFAQMCLAFQDAGLSPQQVQICACDLVVAGYLTTTFILGTGVRNLLLNPEQLRKLREDPSLVHAALEEMLRFDGPVQLLDRCAATETEVLGHKFKPGDRASTVIGSADRDPARFSEPDSFEIQRGETTHFGFGGGIHECIGAPLVRKVAPVGLEMLLDAFSELAIDGAEQWQTDPYLRATTSLPLRF
jgi:cytochrome P450